MTWCAVASHLSSLSAAITMLQDRIDLLLAAMRRQQADFPADGSGPLARGRNHALIRAVATVVRSLSALGSAPAVSDGPVEAVVLLGVLTRLTQHVEEALMLRPAAPGSGVAASSLFATPTL